MDIYGTPHCYFSVHKFSSQEREIFKEEFPVIVYDHSLYGYYLSLFPPKGSD